MNKEQMGDEAHDGAKVQATLLFSGMRHRLLPFVLSAVLVHVSQAQGFHQHYGGDRSQVGRALVADPTGITTVVQDASQPDGAIRLRLLRTDLQGASPVWTDIPVNGSWFAQDALASGDGALLICGSFIRSGRNDQDAFILRVSTGGTITWSWSTDTPDQEEELLGLTRLTNGDIAAAGNHRSGGDSDGFLVRITATGAALWSHHYGTANDERVKALAEQGTDLVAVGRIMNFTGETDAYILRVDADGNELEWQSWGSIHNEDLHDVVRSGNEVVMVGYTEGEAATPWRAVYLMAFNAAGDTLRTRTWSDLQYTTEAHCLTLAANGDLIIGGERGKDRRTDALALRTTGGGTLLWQRNYDLQRDDRIDGLEAMGDGGFVGTGRCFGPQSGEVLLLRRNSNGE